MRQSKLIKHYRLKRGMSQTDLASFLGVTKQFISKLENGKSKLPLDKILITSEFLDIPIEKVKRALLSDAKEEIYKNLEVSHG